MAGLYNEIKLKEETLSMKLNASWHIYTFALKEEEGHCNS
jgi:hypothetical protein